VPGADRDRLGDVIRTLITQARTARTRRAGRLGAPGLRSRDVLLLAMVCGVGVGNVYFPQAISPLIASSLHIQPAAAATIVTTTQLGYGVGLFALVPLGDRIRHRRLIVGLLAMTGLWLLAAAAAPDAGVLLAAGALVGVSTVVAPVVGPMAAGLVTERRRGAVSGALLSGSLGGMLLSRALGGPLSQWLGWRAVSGHGGADPVVRGLRPAGAADHRADDRPTVPGAARAVLRCAGG
jgi:MFS family permease